MHIDQHKAGYDSFYIVHHTSMSDLLDLVDAFEEKEKQRFEECAKKDQSFERHSADPRLAYGWTHGRLANYAGTRDCLRYANVPEYIIEKARAFQDALMATDTYRHASEKAQTNKRRRVFELDGGELDIDRHLGHQDECWGRVTRGLQRPVVRLAVSFMTQEDNDESAFAGVAALGTCCALLAEQAGCALEIIATTFTQSLFMGGGSSGVTEKGIVLPIKHADEPFHQNSLLMCGIPGYFRFYAVHRAALGIKIGNGHGGASTMGKELKKHLNIQHLLECAWDKGQQQVFLDDFVKTLQEA